MTMPAKRQMSLDSHGRNASVGDATSDSAAALRAAHGTLRRWVHLEPGEEVVLDVVLGAVVANQFSGDPVWLFLVGPPGALKTEILRSLSSRNEIYELST